MGNLPVPKVVDKIPLWLALNLKKGNAPPRNARRILLRGIGASSTRLFGLWKFREHRQKTTFHHPPLKQLDFSRDKNNINIFGTLEFGVGQR
jgi:hypothetical protein